MKKKIIFILFFCLNIAAVTDEHLNKVAAVGYQVDSSGYKESASYQPSSSDVDNQNKAQDDDQKTDLFAEMLKIPQAKADELRQILSNPQNSTVELQKWLDANPDCAKQLQQLIKPEQK